MKPCLTAFLLCLLMAAPGAFAQLADLEVRENFKRVDIRFEYINGFVIVPVLFEGLLPLNFIFDTGAEHTIITQREITDLLQIDYKRRFTILGSDLSTELYAYLAQGVNLKMGDILAKNRAVLVLEEDYMRFEDYAGIDIHGILGADFFRRFIVRIDYRRQVISFFNPNNFEGPGEAFTEVDARFLRSKPYLMADVAQGSDSSHLNFLLDTGAALPLLINTQSAPGLHIPERVIPTNLGAGLGGFLLGYQGQVDELKLPPFTFSQVVTSYQEYDLPNIDTTQLDRRNGIIGNGILRRFTVVLNYIEEKAYFAPNKYYKEEFKKDRSGLLIIASGPALNQFDIYSVLDDSPAGQAGLKPGDEILRVNWMPASLLSLEGIIRRLQKQPGKRIRMKVRRGEAKFKVAFLLEDLL